MRHKEEDLKHLLQQVFEDRGFDFRQYNVDMLERRLARRLSAVKVESYSAYEKILNEDEDECKRLFDELTINVSYFFRNALTFELIYEVVLPQIIAYKQETKDKMIRIWSAGCGKGEEPFSVAILLTELLGDRLKNYDISIYATDTDGHALDKAKVGEYTEAGVINVKKRILNEYFEYDGNYKLKEGVKKMVEFSQHSLVSEKAIVPPKSIFTNFDLILCRNVLIYFTKALQEKVLANFRGILNRKGYLILGAAETMAGYVGNGFICVDRINNIYQKP